jgi:hypothetical protein
MQLVVALPLAACGSHASVTNKAAAVSTTTSAPSASPDVSPPPSASPTFPTRRPVATPRLPSPPKTPAPATECSTSEVTQHLSTDRSSYQRGQTVHVSAWIINSSSHPCWPIGSENGSVVETGHPDVGLHEGVAIDYVAGSEWLPSENVDGPLTTWDEVVTDNGGHTMRAPPGTYTITEQWANYPPISVEITLVGPAPSPASTPTPTPPVPLP